MTVTAEGFTYDPETRDWTKRVTYEARDRMEAVRWINFNRDYMKGLRIVYEHPNCCAGCTFCTE